MNSPYITLVGAVFKIGQEELAAITLTEEQAQKLAALFEAEIATLTEREADITRRRFGIGYETHTFKELGEASGLSLERTRQIQMKALRKLIHPQRSQGIRLLLIEAGVFESSEEVTAQQHYLLLKEKAANNTTLSDAELATISIERLGISIRSANCLKNEGINTLLDLKAKTEVDLRKMLNFGRKSFLEVRDAVAPFGVHLENGYAGAKLVQSLKERVGLGEVLGDSQLAKVTLEDLKLSLQCSSFLKDESVSTLLDLKNKRMTELLRTPNFGRKMLHEIEDVLAQFGLKLS